MDQSQLSIATITWARNSDEEQLLKTSLSELAKLNITVYITDGGSSDTFLEFIKTRKQFVLLKANAKGVWAQAKSSLLAAYTCNSRFILYTEPDKHNFFKNQLPLLLDEVALDDTTGIINAVRSKEALATFPAFQQMTETAINNCCAEITGTATDYTYGPFILNRKLVPYLNLINEDIGWGWRPYTFGIAKRLGYKLDVSTGDFTCPPEQRNDDQKERIYRMKQLYQNIQGIVLSTSVTINEINT